MFTLGAFAIIPDSQGRVLLCHRRDMDAWNLPGGGVEPGELPTEAVIREVREETGLQIEIRHLVGVYGKPQRDDLVFAFLCAVTGGILSPTDESDQNHYFAVDSLPANTLPKHVERIHDAMGPGPFPIIRRQVSPSTRDWLEERKDARA